MVYLIGLKDTFLFLVRLDFFILDDLIFLVLFVLSLKILFSDISSKILANSSIEEADSSSYTMLSI